MPLPAISTTYGFSEQTFVQPIPELIFSHGRSQYSRHFGHGIDALSKGYERTTTLTQRKLSLFSCSGLCRCSLPTMILPTPLDHVNNNLRICLHPCPLAC